MNKNSLLDLWRIGVHNVDPIFMLSKQPQKAPTPHAYLFWGKASVRFLEAVALARGTPILGIYPRVNAFQSAPFLGPGRWIAGEHPLPGDGSFQAGAELLEFFDSLRRRQARRLTVFLSGGASSLAWLPRAGLSREEVLRRLRDLYRAGLDIDELNAERSRLCQLKAGGAGRWLSRLAPRVRAQVFVLSDVAPHGPDVVGSGPFWDGKIPHRVLADNETLVQALAAEARGRKIDVLHSSGSHLGSWQRWMQTAMGELRPALRDNRKGLFIFGGEPSVRLPKGAMGRPGRSGRGGRQTHLALALAAKLRTWVLQGRVEILAMSTDGSDGTSGAAGAWLDPVQFPARFARVGPSYLRKCLFEHDSARLLSRLGALVAPDSIYPHSNVQDVLMIRIH